MFSLFFEHPLVFLAWVVAFIIALSVHEFCHALVATLLGDRTPEQQGRLTLNPMSHIDWIGFLMVLFIGFGWGKPVQFNPYQIRFRRWGPVLIAAAGPLSNLILAFLSVGGILLFEPSLGMTNVLLVFLAISAQLNISLLIFNLIPLPPLDGSKVVLALLDHPNYRAWRMRYESQGPMWLLGLLLIDSFAHLGIFSGLFEIGVRFLFAMTHLAIF